MRPQDLVIQVRAMKGLMPECNRSLIAGRLAAMITKTIDDNMGKTSEAAEVWADKGLFKFFEACQLTEPIPKHPKTDAESVSLAGFIARWNSLNGWRPKDSEDDAEWRDFTEEQNLIRFTMLRELHAMAHGQQLPVIPTRKKEA